MTIFESLIFICALSLDTLAVGFAYGSGGIKIPVISSLSINFLCSAILCIAMKLGKGAAFFSSERITAILGSLIMFIPGIEKIFEFLIKKYLKKRSLCAESKFQPLLKLICDSTSADKDHSKTLSCKEAASLALSLSSDGFAAGIGGGMSGFSTPVAFACSFIFGSASVFLGSFLGNRAATRKNLDLSLLGGIILIAVAFFNLLEIT